MKQADYDFTISQMCYSSDLFDLQDSDLSSYSPASD